MSKKKMEGPELPGMPKSPVFVECWRCHHTWKICTLPLPISVWTKAMKAAICPECGETARIYLKTVPEKIVIKAVSPVAGKIVEVMP